MILRRREDVDITLCRSTVFALAGCLVLMVARLRLTKSLRRLPVDVQLKLVSANVVWGSTKNEGTASDTEASEPDGESSLQLDQSDLRHIAIIADGSGRWSETAEPTSDRGRKAGVSAVRTTVEAMLNLALKPLTLRFLR